MRGKGRVHKLCLFCHKSIYIKASAESKVFYCSKGCMAKDYKVRMAGKNNPNYRGSGWRICETCGNKYHNYNKKRRYCSFYCYVNSEGYVRGRAKKDNNHLAIVKAITENGGAVLDLSVMGKGVPDLIVNTKKGIHLAEIKNPNTHYGRSGLSKLQMEWAIKWRGAPVFILKTEEDAINLVRGEFGMLEHYGGGGDPKLI